VCGAWEERPSQWGPYRSDRERAPVCAVACTNSYGDWLNVALVPCTSVGDNELQTPSGAAPLTVGREEILVKGAQPVVCP
jgi:hypothetical protein